jgi:hypothetical protein
MSGFDNPGVVLASLLDETVEFIRRYAGITTEQADAIALLVAASWTISEWRTMPYLFITAADRECGKTRLGEEVIGMLVRRALKAATATPAALIRSLEDETTVLIYDEIDAVWGGKSDDPSAPELKTVFNAGFKRGMPALKCSGPGHTVSEFNVFGPKVLIGIGDKLPETVASRCIRIRMERLAAGEEVADFDEDDAGAEAQPLVDQYEAWADSIASQGRLRVKLDKSVFPVRNRERDKWRPLFTIAREAGADWPARVHAACLALSGQRAEASYPVQVLAAAWRSLGEADRMATSDLILRMVEDDDTGPWSGWVEKDHSGELVATRGGESRLGRALKNFGDPPLKADRWQAGDERSRGYTRSQLLPFVQRYVQVGQVGQGLMVEPKAGDSKLGSAPSNGQLQIGDLPPNRAPLPNLPNSEPLTEAEEAEIERLRAVYEQFALPPEGGES